MEGLFTGAIIAISSTTIIAKAFDEQKIEGQRCASSCSASSSWRTWWASCSWRRSTAVASGAGLSVRALALTIGRLACIPAGARGGGILVVPRSVRAMVRLNRPETTLVASIGLCFAVALLAQVVRLFRRARGVHCRLAGGRIGGRKGSRAPRHARARHVRGDLLRLGGHVHRPRVDRRPFRGCLRVDAWWSSSEKSSAFRWAHFCRGAARAPRSKRA